MTNLQKVKSNWLPYFGEKLPQRLEQKVQDKKRKDSIKKELISKERFILNKELNIGFVLNIISPEMDQFQFASGLEDRLGKLSGSGPEAKRTIKFEESQDLKYMTQMNNLLLGAMVNFWGVDIDTAEYSSPNRLDIISLETNQKHFKFGDKYKFIICLGDPVILKKDLKGKDFVLSEGGMFFLKNISSTAFMNFNKFAPIKEEANFKMKSYMSTMLLCFYKE